MNTAFLTFTLVLAIIGIIAVFIFIVSRAEYNEEQEFVFVDYKDTVIPMRAWQKELVWDKYDAGEKREVYLNQQRMIKKGQVVKVDLGEGKFLLSLSGKKSDIEKAVKNYEKSKQSI